MRTLWLCLLAGLTVLSHALQASARDLAGVGRLLTNDAFATITDDRWRTGSGVLSVVWARDGSLGGGPSRVGDILEFRFRGELITPENLVTSAPGDRPYAAAISFGLHTHFSVQAIDVSVGADLVLTGPQTGLPDLQAAIHRIIDVPEPSAATLAAQLPNNIYGAAVFEASRSFALSNRTTLRPFVELQGGVETLARIGADLHFGQVGRGEFTLRDIATGHRYRVRRDTAPGWAAVLGADLAYVDSSIFLPSSSGVALKDTRSRVRAGVHWQNQSIGLFYGVTWLSEEFETQSDTQLLGSFRLDVLF